MTSGDPRDRLQPALLDRLVDDDRTPVDAGPARPPPSPGGGWRPRGAPLLMRRAAPAQALDADRTMSTAQLRQAVLRDLGALFNAVRPLDAPSAEQHPRLAATVLNFGLPPLAGELASRLDPSRVERILRETILRFEPRILPESLAVRALEAGDVLDTHNVVEFEISGHLWSQPIPLEILLRTQVDLEAGQVRIREAG